MTLPDLAHPEMYGVLLGHVCLCFPNASGTVLEQGSSLSQIRLSTPLARQQEVTLLHCPNNSTTHPFLACDVKSACWGQFRRALFSCKAPLTPLPPMMTCSNGVQYVPYTLVCDHRPDCSDNSDEDFCVFPDCEATTGEQVDCGNKQVVMLWSFNLHNCSLLNYIGSSLWICEDVWSKLAWWVLVWSYHFQWLWPFLKITAIVFENLILLSD